MKFVEAALKQKAAMAPHKKRLILPQAPMPRAPKEIERQYYNDILKTVIDPLRQLCTEMILPSIGRIMVDALRQTATMDSVHVRADAYAQELKTMFEDVRVSYGRKLTEKEITDLVAKYAHKGDAFNRQQIASMFHRVLGLQPLAAEPWLSPVMMQFTAENTALIKSIGDKFLQDIEAKTFRYIQKGVHNTKYAQVLNRDYASEFRNQYNEGVLQNQVDNTMARAKLIARDQVSKYNGQLNMSRQTNLGISKYRWVTAGDERVRDSHKRKNGRIYSWDSPPADTGHPGQDYQCRCQAVAIFDVDVTDDPGLLRLLNG